MSNMDESDPMMQLKEIEELEKKRAQVLFFTNSY